jgi:hypothetical protein
LERVGEALIINLRRARLGVPVVAAAISIGLSAVAYGRLSGTNYHGHTSQRQKISFRIVENLSVRRLGYRIVDACPKGKKVIDRDFGFPPMPIVRGRFGGTFYDRAHDAKAVISGSMSKGFITGSLSDRTKNKLTHQLCNGHARFSFRLH